jgi:glycosyltransferase involved in cell wall biosynthesis
MINRKPRVSVGLPVFNAERYLEQAIDSILAQTYIDFELVISDNASTDRTPAICQTYAAKDPRVRYHCNSRNLGMAPNFNRAFQLSSGGYFKWAAYDDRIAPEFLSRCVEVLDRHPAVVLCYARAQLIDENGSFTAEYDPQPDTSSPKPQERFRNLILAPELAVQQMGLIRRTALEKTELHGSYPSSDEVLLAELALLGDFYEIPERLLIYRLHSEQLTQGKTRTARERVVSFDTALEGKIVLHKWLYFFACLRAIRRPPLTRYQRTYCHLQMIRWLLDPPHFRAMGKDVLLAANQYVRWILRRGADGHRVLGN